LISSAVLAFVTVWSRNNRGDHANGSCLLVILNEINSLLVRGGTRHAITRIILIFRENASLFQLPTHMLYKEWLLFVYGRAKGQQVGRSVSTPDQRNIQRSCCQLWASCAAVPGGAL
jgi:hypothetical protein